MAYRAVIQNKETQKYLSNKGFWCKNRTTISVASRSEAYKVAERLNGVVVQIKIK